MPSRPPPEIVARRPFRRRVVLNTVAGAAANGWAMVATLASLPFVLHGLGRPAFGAWVIVQTFSARRGWFSIADLGIGAAATRTVAARAANDSELEAGRVTSSALALCALMGVVCAAILVLAGPPLLPHLIAVDPEVRAPFQAALRIFAAQVLLEMIGEAAGDCLSGLQRTDLARILDALRRTLVAAGTAIAATMRPDLEWVAAASVVATGIALAASLLVLLRRVRVLPAPSRTTALSLLSQGGPMGALAVFGVIQGAMDRVVVGAIVGTSGVTLVEIAAQLQAGADAVLAAVSVAVLPTAAWLGSRGDTANLRDLVQRGARYSLVVTVPVAVSGMVLAGALIDVWLGPRYADARRVAVVALGAPLLFAAFQVPSLTVQALGKAGAVLKPYALATLANVAVTVGLVYAWGPIGAFGATLITAPGFLLPIARVIREVTGVTLTDLFRGCVLPVLPAVALMVAIESLVLVLSLSSLASLLLASSVGVTAFAIVAARTAFAPSELRQLLRFGG